MKNLLPALSVTALVVLALPANAQQYKYQTPATPGVATPDKVDTSIGTLKLHDGYPMPRRSRRFMTTSTHRARYRLTCSRFRL